MNLSRMSPNSLKIHAKVPRLSIPPEVLYYNKALTNATAFAMSTFK